MHIHTRHLNFPIQVQAQNANLSKICSLYSSNRSLNKIVNHPPDHTLSPARSRVRKRIQVERAHACEQVHIPCLDEKATLVLCVDFPEYVQRDNDWSGEVGLEESFSVGAPTDGLYANLG